MSKQRIIFDLDGTIATALGTYELEKQLQAYYEDYGTAFIERHMLTAMDIPHLIFPGYYVLLPWLHQQGWAIDFFSGGVKSRNQELVDKLMQQAFGAELDKIDYRVFSRQHAIDTQQLDMRSKDGHGGKIYQSFFYGQLKKKITDVVVPAADIPNTLLVDDDKSYITAGEEKNIICLHYSFEYPKKNHSFRDGRYFQIMHNAYYLAGLLEAILIRAEQGNIPLNEAAYQVQLVDFGRVTDKDLYDYPSLGQMDFYHRGLALLQNIEPSLSFYLEIKAA